MSCSNEHLILFGLSTSTNRVFDKKYMDILFVSKCYIDLPCVSYPGYTSIQFITYTDKKCQ